MSPQADDYKQEVFAEQVKQLYALMPYGIVATVVNSLIVLIVLHAVMPKNLLFIWIGVLLAVSLLRIYLAALFRRTDFNVGSARVWGKRFIFGTAVSGLVWGSMGLFPFSHGSGIVHEVFIAFVLGGMAAGAASAFSVFKWGYLSYSIPALLPLAMRFFVLNGMFRSAMGTMLILYGVLLWRISHRHYLVNTESLTLRFENREIIEQLKSAKEDTEKLYKDLLLEIEAKKKAEAELRRYHEHLETLIEERTRKLRLSEKQALEQSAELERKNKELDNFASIAAHDLRAPLRAVTGFVELFTENFKGNVDAKSRKYLFRIEQGVERMQLLIDDLLQYARAGRAEKTPVEIDMNALLQKVMANLSEEFAASGAVITRETLPNVYGDATELTQVLQNLIANAIKYRREAPHINVVIEKRFDEWVFRISDNGIGIDPEQFERIFEPFQRLHPSDQYSGTGMGLAICKKIVERFGGRIWVESKPGEGSTFFFTVPMREGT